MKKQFILVCIFLMTSVIISGCVKVEPKLSYNDADVVSEFLQQDGCAIIDYSAGIRDDLKLDLDSYLVATQNLKQYSMVYAKAPSESIAKTLYTMLIQKIVLDKTVTPNTNSNKTYDFDEWMSVDKLGYYYYIVRLDNVVFQAIGTSKDDNAVHRVKEMIRYNFVGLKN